MKRFFKTRKFNDSYRYHLSEKVISDSERVFEDYASFDPSHEGIVYWAGIREGNTSIVKCVVAPRAESHPGGVRVSHDANFEFIKFLSANKLVQIGQVHTHPWNFVGHSDGDDRYAAFKVNGLLSLVVPRYSESGMTPLTRCGVHRFMDGKFIRLPNYYVRKHFQIKKRIQTDFEDLR